MAEGGKVVGRVAEGIIAKGVKDQAGLLEGAMRTLDLEDER